MVKRTRLNVKFIHTLPVFFVILFHDGLSIMGYIASHGRKVNNEIGIIWTVMAYFKVASYNFPQQTLQKTWHSSE
jgi:hypothetical protein